MKLLNRKNADIISNRPVKILQFGTGNFLRGFIDWAVDILNEKTSFNGDIQIVQPHGKSPATALNEQEGLYHVITRGFQNGQVVEEERLISSVRSAINPYLEYESFLALADNPELRLMVSNTTEAGIYFDPKDNQPENVSASFPGKLTALLYRRFSVFQGDPAKGLIHLPCELIEQNGQKLKEAVLQYAALWNLGTEFEQWINEHNTFCNTLVDRIVPGLPQENVHEIEEKIGFEDKQMVMTEPFHLWIIEGPQSLEKEFPIGKTGLDIYYADDLSPYRTRKVRILNGAHTAMVPLAYLRGLRTVREAVEDPFIGNFLTQTVYNEIIPTLDLPKEELEKFAQDVIERFKNPFIKHQLKDIALNSVSKFQVRVLPSLLEYYQRKKQLPENLVLSFAALIVFYRGNYRGESLPVRDTPEVMDFFQELWQNENSHTIATQVLAQTTFWQQNLNNIEGLSDLLAEKITILLSNPAETPR
jgi:tagaturonate reductase